MKKTVLLNFILSFLIINKLGAQIIPNGSFEDFEYNSKGNHVPTKWDGTIKNVMMVFQNAPDKPIDGKNAVALTNLYSSTRDYDSSVAKISNRFLLSTLPTKLSSYIKYYRNQKNEKFLITVLLFNNSGFGVLDTIGYGSYSSETNGEITEWTNITVDIAYRKNIRPDSALLNFYTSQKDGFNSQTTFLIDDVRFTDTLTSLSLNFFPASNPFNFEIYPNPIKENLTFTINERDGKQIFFSIIDVTGRLIKEGDFQTTTINQYSIELLNFKAGTYFLKISNRDIEQSKPFIIRE